MVIYMVILDNEYSLIIININYRLFEKKKKKILGTNYCMHKRHVLSETRYTDDIARVPDD